MIYNPFSDPSDAGLGCSVALVFILVVLFVCGGCAIIALTQ